MDGVTTIRLPRGGACLTAACLAVLCLVGTASPCDSHYRDPLEMIELHYGPNISARRLLLRGDAYLEMARSSRFKELNLTSAKDVYLKAIADYSEILRLTRLRWDGDATQHRVALLGLSQRGIAYFELGDYDNAIADFTSLIALQDTLANTYRFLRGTARYFKRDFDEAAKDFEDAGRLADVGNYMIEPSASAFQLARQKRSANASRRYMAGLAKYVINRYYEADDFEYLIPFVNDCGLGEFKVAKKIDLFPFGARKYDYMTARAYVRMGNPDSAAALIAGLIRRAPMSAKFYALRGDARSHPDSAAADYAIAMRLAPNSADLRIQAARHYLTNGNDSMAVASVIDAVRLEPDRNYNLSFFSERKQHLNLYRELARAFPNRAEYHAESGDLDRAIELAPDNAKFHYLKGNAHLKQKEYAPAIAALSEAIRLSPANGTYLTARGKAYLASGTAARDDIINDFFRAILYTETRVEDYRRNVRLSDDIWNDIFSELIRVGHSLSAEVYFFRGRAAAAKKEFDKAAADLTMAILYSQVPDGDFVAAQTEARYLAARAHVHLTAGDTAKAIADYAERERVFPVHMRTVYNEDDYGHYRLSWEEEPSERDLIRTGLYLRILEEVYTDKAELHRRRADYYYRLWRAGYYYRQKK